MKVARFAVIAAALTTVLCSSVLETAAQPQPILGCVMPGTGLLRIPSSDDGCRREETPLGFSDLPLLVALRTQVEGLQEQVTALQGQVAALQDRVAALEACASVIPECTPE